MRLLSEGQEKIRKKRGLEAATYLPSSCVHRLGGYIILK
jgi:hypothetical protein